MVETILPEDGFWDSYLTALENAAATPRIGQMLVTSLLHLSQSLPIPYRFSESPHEKEWADLSVDMPIDRSRQLAFACRLQRLKFVLALIRGERQVGEIGGRHFTEETRKFCGDVKRILASKWLEQLTAAASFTPGNLEANKLVVKLLGEGHVDLQGEPYPRLVGNYLRVLYQNYRSSFGQPLLEAMVVWGMSHLLRPDDIERVLPSLIKLVGVPKLLRSDIPRDVILPEHEFRDKDFSYMDDALARERALLAIWKVGLGEPVLEG